MKYLLIYLFIIIAAFGCSNDDRFVEFNQPDKYQKIKRSIRTIQEVEQIIYTVDPYTKSSGVNIQPLTARDVAVRSIASNPNDTLLYIVEGVDKPMIISANLRCYPIIAMFDSPNISILHELANPSESNSGVMAFIEQAIFYNQNPNDFDVYCNTKGPWRIKEKVMPKVPVEWDLEYPFNKYVPNQCQAGCVAIAVAHAFMVTRHVNSFNDIPLDYDQLIKVKDRRYEKDFPSESNTIARFIHEIGKSIDMKYGVNGSKAETSDAIKLFTTKGKRMLVDEEKSNILYRLKNFSNSIVLIQSSTNKTNYVIHAYIADGYRIYSDEGVFLHINFGAGPLRNGYFLYNLTDPKFLECSPYKYPNDFHFYCLYK